jgi:hypothetical protein
LTINPDTGLPEAGWVDKLLPAVIGFAVNTFAPGIGTAIGEALGTSAAVGTGIAVGGAEALRTGDISRGLQAGLGAYGGANLGASFTGAGEGLIGEQALAGSVGREAVARNIMENQMTEEAARSAVMKEAVANAGPFDKLSAGFEAATGKGGMQALKAASPMNAPGLGYSAAMAAGPAILAEMSAKKNMPQTVTQPGMIRPYSYDPISQQYFGGTPYKAAEGGLMGMASGGYSPGMLDFTQKSEPVVRMAEGGLGSVVRMANGTPPEMLTDEQLYQKTGSWEAAAAARDAQNNAMNQYTWQQQADARDQAARAANIMADAARLSGSTSAATAPDPQAQALQRATTSTTAPAPVVPDASDWWASQPGGVNAMYDYINNQLNTTFKNATDAQIDAAMKQYGISSEDVHNALQKGGGSKAEEYSLLAGNMGLSGLNQNINDWISKANADPRFKNLTPEQKRAEAMAAMGTVNMNEADVLRATGKTIAELFPKVLTCPPGYHKSADGLSCEKDTVVPGNFTEVPVTLFPGAGGGGNTVVNANGTITTGPNIPGIPPGGFTGMGQVRDVYEKGGGNLGYTSPTFASLKAVEDKYPLTGGSQQSYNYLTGKTPYSPVPWSPTGEIARPYAEAVLGMPANISKKMYLFDPATKTYKINPDYAIPTRNAKGQVTTSLTNRDVADYVAKAPSYDALYTWMTANNLSPEQVALASGKPFTEINKQFLKAQGVTDSEGKIDQTKVDAATADDIKTNWDETAYLAAHPDVANELKTGKSVTGQPVQFSSGYEHWLKYGKASGVQPITKKAANGGLMAMAMARGGATQYDLGDYSDGGRLLRGPGDGVSDSIPASIGNKRPARLADGEFVVPARIVSELGNGSTEAGARKLYAMMDRIQAARRGTVGKGRVAKNSRSEKYLPA